MKPKKLLLLAAVLGIAVCIGAGSICASAQEQPVGNACLTVTGCASVEAEADLCTFGGCVEAAGNDMRAAEEAAAALLRTVKDTFAAYGTVSEESSSAYPTGATGYTAVKYLSFVTDKADKAEEIRAALAKTGVTCLDGVRFSCKEDGEYKLEALRLAIENAREKAKALGAEGELVHVEEQCCYPCARGGTSDGKVTYTATVRAVFAKARHADARGGQSHAPAEGGAEG